MTVKEREIINRFLKNSRVYSLHGNPVTSLDDAEKAWNEIQEENDKRAKATTFISCLYARYPIQRGRIWRILRAISGNSFIERDPAFNYIENPEKFEKLSVAVLDAYLQASQDNPDAHEPA